MVEIAEKVCQGHIKIFFGISSILNDFVATYPIISIYSYETGSDRNKDILSVGYAEQFQKIRSKLS